MSKKCMKCPKNIHCCIGGFAFVGIRDAIKIQKFIKRDFNYFLDYSRLSFRDLYYLKNDDPSLEGHLRYSLVKGGKILRLKKKDGQCIFLREGKCTIYKVRPKICRIYPYWCIKLIDGYIQIVDHDFENVCGICSVSTLKIKEKDYIKKLFLQISKETEYYVRNIKEFIKKNRIK